MSLSKPIVGRRRAAWLVLIGLALYTILVGPEPSVVRAAIVGGLFIVAFFLMGRPTFAAAARLVAAIAMIFIDPLILWSLGFQLSFAATLGLMRFIGPSSW